MKVVGIREVNYTSKKTGKEVQGIEVHGTYPSSRCTGVLTDKQFLSMFIIEKNGGLIPEIGDEFIVSYNRYGQVDHYEVVPSCS